MKRKPLNQLTSAALIAALYAALTLALAPLSFGVVQLRAAEALTLLPLYLPESVPGLFAGCLIANAVGVALGFAGPWDIVIGSLATLAAAFLTSRCKNRWTGALMPVAVNALTVGPMLALLFAAPGARDTAITYYISTVALGEAGAVFLFGIPLSFILDRILPSLKRRKK